MAAGSLISACSTKNQDGGLGKDAATGGTAGSAAQNTAGGGASGGGMTASGGASGGGTSGGESGGATSGGVSGSSGSSGGPAAGGSGGSAGSSGGGGGLVDTPGCAQSTHPVCMDFETLPGCQNGKASAATCRWAMRRTETQLFTGRQGAASRPPALEPSPTPPGADFICT